MIRPTTIADTPPLLALTEATGMFKPAEIVALDEVLHDYHASNRELGHRSITIEIEGEIKGFAYFAPASMTDRTWYLYWIAVSKDRQAAGLGGQMLRHVEEEIRRQQGRLLLVETSSTPHYDLTRRFYLKHGYKQTAAIADFYADNDSMVVFAKRLASQ